MTMQEKLTDIAISTTKKLITKYIIICCNALI
jgi:hypothetical protein